MCRCGRTEVDQELIGVIWIPPPCADCQHEVDQKRTAREAEAQIADEVRRMRDSGLPRAYVTGERLLGHVPPHAASSAIALQHGLSRGLYLWGPAGAFKTSLAAAFLATEIRGGGTGRYVSATDLLADIQASYQNDGETRSDIVRRFIATPRLVMDDLGKEKASEHAANVIFQILDGRYRMQGPGRWTIVTSNYPLPALCARFDGAIGDPIERRIAEMTTGVEMKRRAA
jgi:hypothetical protein